MPQVPKGSSRLPGVHDRLDGRRCTILMTGMCAIAGGAATCNFVRNNETFSCAGDDYEVRQVQDRCTTAVAFLVLVR